MNEWMDTENEKKREKEKDYDKLSNLFVLSFSLAQE
jgi:hypothetical protein